MGKTVKKTKKVHPIKLEPNSYHKKSDYDETKWLANLNVQNTRLVVDLLQFSLSKMNGFIESDNTLSKDSRKTKLNAIKRMLKLTSTIHDKLQDLSFELTMTTLNLSPIEK